MDEFKRILAEHRRRYPDMEPQDYGKLAYQSEFGPEHMVSDREAVLDRLRRERAETGETPIPAEDIGNGLCRVHLEGMGEADLTRLADAFLASAAAHRGTRAGLLARLALLRELEVPGMEAWLAWYEAQGYPPVRHSPRFRALYTPHYRVIKWDYLK